MSLLAQLSAELEALVARAAPAVVGIEHARGQGSGVVLAGDGYVVTNAHVVGAAPLSLRVRVHGGEVAPASIVGSDARTDLAVVRAEATGLPSLALADDDRPRVGQLVVAIGNPLRFDGSVTLGVVSALHRALPGRDGPLEALVQTDAAVNPGNSGGPLLDVAGDVVGITTAVLPYAQGMGFALPSRTASWVASVLLRDGEVRRPLLGITAFGCGLRGDEARAAAQPRGVRVAGVATASPAERAGLRRGDLLLAADGARVESTDDLQRTLVLSGREDVRLTLLREGSRLHLTARPRVERSRAA